MKKVLAGWLALIGIGGSVAAETKMVDPQTILFSMSTISDDMAPLEQIDHVDLSDLIFHEDEWRQVEFFDRSRLSEIERTLTELKAFATAHQQRSGWSKIYVRKLTSEPVVQGSTSIAKLESLLGIAAKAGPVMFTGGNSLVGRVARGFSLQLGGGVALYGFGDEAGISVLGANVAAGGDDQTLTRAFQKLSLSDHLILVDWRAQMVLIAVAEDGRIEAWRP